MEILTKLETLRSLVEKRVDDLLIPILLDKSIEYHTRKGLRTWCDCSYCEIKRKGTNSIYNVGTYVHYDHYGCDVNDWTTWARINARRKVEIDNLRDKLKQEQELL